MGRRQDNAYDVLDRLTQQTWFTFGGTAVNTQVYSYDANSNVLTAKDNTGTITTAYDALNRVTSETDVWGLTLTYSYDGSGNVTVVKDSLGCTATSISDAADRLTSRQFSDRTTPSPCDL